MKFFASVLFILTSLHLRAEELQPAPSVTPSAPTVKPLQKKRKPAQVQVKAPTPAPPEPKLFGYVQDTKYEAGTYHANTYGGFLSYKLDPRFQPSLGISHAVRVYNGTGDKLQETAYTLGVTSLIQKDIYVEADTTFSPDAQIGPRESYNLTPHWVYGASDFGLRFGYSRYIDSRAGLVVPSVMHEFNDEWTGYAAIYIVRTDTYLWAEQGKISYQPWQRHRFSISGGTGSTLEDAGVSANFKSLGFEYNYHMGRLTWGLAQNNYWSNLRWERSYTLSLGYK